MSRPSHAISISACNFSLLYFTCRQYRFFFKGISFESESSYTITSEIKRMPSCIFLRSNIRTTAEFNKRILTAAAHTATKPDLCEASTRCLSRNMHARTKRDPRSSYLRTVRRLVKCDDYWSRNSMNNAFGRAAIFSPNPLNGIVEKGCPNDPRDSSLFRCRAPPVWFVITSYPKAYISRSCIVKKKKNYTIVVFY